METGQTLIDKAAEKCGGLRRLAEQLDESSSYLSNVRTGKKPISPGIAARIATVAGLDAKRIALEALVSQEKDRQKQIALAAAFGVDVPPEPPTRNGVTVQLA